MSEPHPNACHSALVARGASGASYHHGARRPTWSVTAPALDLRAAAGRLLITTVALGVYLSALALTLAISTVTRSVGFSPLWLLGGLLVAGLTVTQHLWAAVALIVIGGAVLTLANLVPRVAIESITADDGAAVTWH